MRLAAISSKARWLRPPALLLLLFLTVNSAVADVRVFIADDPRGYIDLKTNDGQTIQIPYGTFFYGSWSRHIGYRGCFSGRCGATQGGQHEVGIRAFVVATNNALSSCKKSGQDSFTAFYQCPNGMLPMPTCTIEPDTSLDGDYYSFASCDLLGNDALILLYSVGIAARIETIFQQQEAVERYNEGFRSTTSQGMPYTLTTDTLGTYLRTTCCDDEPGKDDLSQPEQQQPEQPQPRQEPQPPQKPQPRQQQPQQLQPPSAPNRELMHIGFWVVIIFVAAMLISSLWKMYKKNEEHIRRTAEARVERDRARLQEEYQARESARKAESERERHNRTLLDQQKRAAALVDAERNRPVPPAAASLHDELTKLNDAIVESREHHHRETTKVRESNYDPLVKRSAINALDKRHQEELKRLDSEIKTLLANDPTSRTSVEQATFLRASQQFEHRISILTNELIESHMPLHTFRSRSPDIQNCYLECWKRGATPPCQQYNEMFNCIRLNICEMHNERQRVG